MTDEELNNIAVFSLSDTTSTIAKELIEARTQLAAQAKVIEAAEAWRKGRDGGDKIDCALIRAVDQNRAARGGT